MKWSPEQSAALSSVARWLRARDRQVFRLTGYAGTGKTTLAKHLAESVRGPVFFAAYTGKAASVMREKGCADACTIHNLIYKLVEDDDPLDDSPPVRRPRFVFDRDSRARSAGLIVIDEASMVDAAIGRDLVSLGAPILAIYDPFQLPPINGAGFFTTAAPDAALTEVHRQARDNPIIAMATIVRDGGRIPIGRYGDSIVTRGDGIDFDRARLEADQVLVGRNLTRRANNADIRALRGLTDPEPDEGDKLVCLRNDHELGLFNGSTWIVDRVRAGGSDDPIELAIAPEGGGPAVDVTTHAWFFNNGGELSYPHRCRFSEFDFGYALTVHKAQGSQWDRVLLINESRCFYPDDRRWLYTGITRAAKQITAMT